MTNWHQLERRLDRTVGRAFGGRVRFCPMTPSGRADPARAAQNISGVLHVVADDGTVDLGRGETLALAGCHAALVVERSQWPDLAVREGDKMQDVEIPGTPWYRVARVSDRYTSILVVALTAA